MSRHGMVDILERALGRVKHSLTIRLKVRILGTGEMAQ